MLSLLVLPYLVLAPLRVSQSLRGRIGIALVMAFAAVGHFAMTAQMAQMLPPWVPMRIALIYASGVFEVMIAFAILVPRFARITGIVTCIYLLAILPSNVYAAVERVDFGGHAAGPAYLLVRVPLQLILVGWTYFFAVRRPAVRT